MSFTGNVYTSVNGDKEGKNNLDVKYPFLYTQNMNNLWWASLLVYLFCNDFEIHAKMCDLIWSLFFSLLKSLSKTYSETSTISR